MAPIVFGTLTALFVAIVVTRIARGVALRYDHVDRPDERKRHGRPVPRLGGVGIALGVVAGLVATALLGGVAWAETAPLLVGAVGIAALGFWDDLHEIGFKRRFAIQMVIAYGMILAGWHVDVSSLPFLQTLGAFEQTAIALPLTMLWTVGLINAMNLMDGLDGLAGGVSAIAFGALALAYATSGDALLLVLCAVSAAATLGFLVYNVAPASIFMGDTGSTLLGFLLAMAGLRGIDSAPTLGLLAVPAVALGLPLLDTLTTMTRRIAHGTSPFLPDADHIHHRVLARSGSVRGAVWAMWGAGAVFGTIAVALQYGNASNPIQALCILVALAFSYLVVRRLRYVRIRVLLRRAQRRRIHRRRALIQVAMEAREERGDGFQGDGAPRYEDVDVVRTARS